MWCVCTCIKILRFKRKRNMKSFSNETLNFFFRKFWLSYILDFAKTVFSYANLVVEIHYKLCDKRVLSTGEPCSCECFAPVSQRYIFFRRSFKTAIFSRFLYVAIATSNFMNGFYDGGIAPEFSVSMLKKTIELVWDYVSETRK